MIIEVMCRMADGPLKPGELTVTQAVGPLVSWSVHARDVFDAEQLHGRDLAIELHFPDTTVWTGEAYAVADVQSDHHVQLRGIGALSENATPVHSDVVMRRLQTMADAQHSH